MGKDSSEIRREIEETRDRMGDTVDALAYKADVPNRMKDSISERVGGVKAAIGGAASKVAGAVTGGSSRVGDAVASRAGGTMSDVKSRLGQTLPDAGDVKYGARRAVGMAVENPIGLMIGGLAAGFLAGLMVPATRFENEQIGEVADNLKEQMKATGQEAVQHGKAVMQDVAQAAGQAASESAQDHGQQLAGSARQRAGDVAETVKGTSPYDTATEYDTAAEYTNPGIK
ncbi:MAG: DUF3618 domain-containing protein [Candidatus Eremiobacteraeota bacterium]|nr:DUF3618 domain-containing protein [Candidatus Eremiobacteraeota bacterium]